MASTDSPVKAGFWYCKQAGDQSISTSDAPFYFTHLFCAYADISGTDYTVTIPAQYRDTFASFTKAAKDKNSKIKTLIAIGGEDSEPENFLPIIGNVGSITDAFINSSIKIAREKNFDGLHLSWPCWNSNYQPQDDSMTNLGTFFRKWYGAVTAEASAEKKEPLLLTATVSHRPHIDRLNLSQATYPIDAIKSNLDWINVRAYDFYDALSSPIKIKPPAALDNSSGIEAFEWVDACISDWLNCAVPENKLVIGLPFFGYEWLLVDAAKHDFFDTAKGKGNENKDGYISYLDIKTQSNFKHVFNKDYVADYCYGNKSWIGYDDTDSIKGKVDYFKNPSPGKPRGPLRGYFAWHVCADDAGWTLSKAASEAWEAPAAGTA